MKNADYWRGRFSILEESAHQEADQYIQSLEEMFMDAQRTVQADIERWYGRFASNNGISLTEARKMLTTGQLEEFRWTVDQYIKIGQQANLSAEWLKKLENASAKFHVSRLEAIQTQIQQQLELLYGNQVDSLDALLKKVVGNGYTHTAFEVQKGVGLGWDITGLDQKKLETLLSKPWTTDGRTFSDRIWFKKQELVDSLQKELVQGLLRGDSPQKITDAIQKKFKVSRYQAARLVNTETSYFNALAAKETYKELGVKNVEILETLDSITCAFCASMDRKVVPMSEFQPGVTVPPFHPHCRGTTVPAIDEKYTGERAARTADGKVYYVPANMTFSQWKKAFVDGVKDGLTVAATDVIINITFESPELLALHYEKHQGEFGDITEMEYLDRANQLYREALSDDVEQIMRSDESISKYKFSTNEFLVVTKDGKIRTYFKPEKGSDYWRYEHERN